MWGVRAGGHFSPTPTVHLPCQTASGGEKKPLQSMATTCCAQCNRPLYDAGEVAHCLSCAKSHNKQCLVQSCLMCSMRDCPTANPQHYNVAGCPACAVHELTSDSGTETEPDPEPETESEPETLHALAAAPGPGQWGPHMAYPSYLFGPTPPAVPLVAVLSQGGYITVPGQAPAFPVPVSLAIAVSVSVEPNDVQLTAFNVLPTPTLQYSAPSPTQHTLEAHLRSTATGMRLPSAFASSSSFTVPAGATEVKLSGLEIDYGLKVGDDGLSDNFKVCFIEVCTKYGQTIAHTKPFRICMNHDQLTAAEREARQACM